ncbi:dihydropteroate synthase [Candidatus Sumerlaeota bacterium]
MIWRCANHQFETGRQTLIMGIVNVTPDSFSDGGQLATTDDAVRHACELADQGADIIDIGGESSRPGAEPVSAEQELERIRPVIAELHRQRPELCISIDTVKAQVAEQALAAGASIVNDISGLEHDPQMLATVAASQAGCVIMHMQGAPRTMQRDPQYKDVVRDIMTYLEGRLAAALEAGIQRERICLDPGIGFGKTLAHNLELLRRLNEFNGLERPVLVGPSRKSFIGQALELEVDQRQEGTIAACVAASLNGAAAVRVHEVPPIRRALALSDAIRTGTDGSETE